MHGDKECLGVTQVISISSVVGDLGIWAPTVKYFADW
jgi:hypothetical protein